MTFAPACRSRLMRRRTIFPPSSTPRSIRHDVPPRNVGSVDDSSCLHKKEQADMPHPFLLYGLETIQTLPNLTLTGLGAFSVILFRWHNLSKHYHGDTEMANGTIDKFIIQRFFGISLSLLPSYDSRASSTLRLFRRDTSDGEHRGRRGKHHWCSALCAVF